MKAAVIQSREVAVKQGSILNGDAVGTKVSVAMDRVASYQGWSLRGVPLY